MDELIAFGLGRTWAIAVGGAGASGWLGARGVSWSEDECVAGGTCVAFDTGDASTKGALLLTLGYVVTLVSLMPLSFLNLDDNVGFQASLLGASARCGG